MCCSNSREIAVSLQKSAPCPKEDTADNQLDCLITPTNEEESSNDIERDKASNHDSDSSIA